MARESGRRVLLIGWDAADWQVINPMMDAGKMPNLERLVDEGVIGNLATLTPDLSPMLWTSIATGNRPFKHGILGFTEPDPHTGGIRPITNLSRRNKAIWNILSQTGRKCVVVGWWPSHPVEPIRGVMVSNHYHTAVGPVDKPWPMRPGTVHPARLEENLAALRWHPQRLEAGHILPFVPEAARVDQDKDKRLGTLAKIICETCTIRDATLAILDHEPREFAAVYFDGIDHFSHAFMRYHPPRLDWIPEEDFEIYRHVVESGYHLHDIILGQIMDRVDARTTVILVSDHGFRSDHLRPRHVPREPTGPAVQHRPYGIFAMKGPGVRRDGRIYGATLLDVCPTVLTILGLPVGRDMDGKVLVDAFERAPRITSIPTWDELPGQAGMHPATGRIDPVEAREAIQQLVALGYVEKPDENREKAVAQTVRELDYNLARAYMDADRHLDAAGILEDLGKNWPDEYRFGIQLVTCYQALGRIGEARKLLEGLFERKRANALDAAKGLREWAEAHKDRKPEDLNDAEKQELRRLRSEAAMNPFAMEYLMGSLLFAEGREAEALECLERAEKSDTSQPGLHQKIGAVYLRMNRWGEAEARFLEALRLDPDSAEAHLGLCRCRLGTGRNAEAADAALAAVTRLFHNPMGHFLLGVAMCRQGRNEESLRAMNVALSQNPNFPEAHRWLAYLYKRRLHDHLKAGEHLMRAREASRRIQELKAAACKAPAAGRAQPLPAASAEVNTAHTARGSSHIEGPCADPARTITIVSGLPRAGTSLMMQMLDAGGLPALTDGLRSPDEGNPRGYYEYAPVRDLGADSAWMSEARGKAIKVIAQILPYLPPGQDYRVVFMERDIREVVMSQNRMIARLEKKGARLSDDRLAHVLAGQARWARALLQRRNIPVLLVSFGDAVTAPRPTAERVNVFLGGGLDVEAMAGAVSADLYRQKAGDAED